MPALSRRAFIDRTARTALSAYALGHLGLPAALAAQTAPNIVVIAADDLGWNDVGYHGSPIRTPNIDGLAARGTQLDRFYAWPVCSPTRAAFLTGRSPDRLGVTEPITGDSESHGLPLDEHLLPQTLSAAGYQTWICGKWHLGEDEGYRPHERGFDHFYGHLGGQIDYYEHTSGRIDWQRNGRTVREEGYSTYLLADEAVSLIAGRDTDRPFFLYLPFNAPHTPLAAPQELIDGYADIDAPERRTFAAVVEAMDQSIGQVLDTLDAQGLTDNTLVLFFSDNGANSGQGGDNAPLRGNKGQAFEGGIRTPAVLRWPGVIPGGAVAGQTVAVMDLFPTLAAAAGVATHNSRPFDGQSRWDALKGSAENTPPAALVVLGTQVSAVFDGPWKLVRTPRGDFLYDVIADPDESEDRAAENPAVAQNLGALLDAAAAEDPTAVADTHTEPMTVQLAQNYPNPFNAATAIRFSLPDAAHVSLRIFNGAGQPVATLADRPLAAGSHALAFNAAGLPSGPYFAELRTGASVRRIKMSLIK